MFCLLKWNQERVLVVLSDGSKLFGILRSFDQFANLVLEGAVERIHVGDAYSEKHLGLFLVRGDNIMLTGTVSQEKEELSLRPLRKVSLAEIQEARRVEREAKTAQWRLRQKFDSLMALEES
eukprot:TRINITY_DN3356_c0_g1_i2.p1 TRINITY_DN3356_c0_g1~~TRINITY_DN3356_c0_g1_i2.p1  ORF type:complete len:122 (-),score=22.87 TRINITY_DN3356_c0_g1_i2:46-411(-)